MPWEKQSLLHEHSIGDDPTVHSASVPTQHVEKPAATHDAPKRSFPPPPPPPLPLPLPLPALSGDPILPAVIKKVAHIIICYSAVLVHVCLVSLEC